MEEPNDRLRELGEFIRQQRGTARLSLRRMSEIAGISNPYLSQIERGLRKPSAEILQGIARGLRTSAETLYVRAGIPDDPGDPPDLVPSVFPAPPPSRRTNPAAGGLLRPLPPALFVTGSRTGRRLRPGCMSATGSPTVAPLRSIARARSTPHTSFSPFAVASLTR